MQLYKNLVSLGFTLHIKHMKILYYFFPSFKAINLVVGSTSIDLNFGQRLTRGCHFYKQFRFVTGPHCGPHEFLRSKKYTIQLKPSECV